MPLGTPTGRPTVPEFKRKFGPLTINQQGMSTTVEYDIEAEDGSGNDQLDLLMQERLDPLFFPNLGMWARRKIQHPRFNWLTLDSLVATPRDAPPETDSYSANPRHGWAVVETYKGQHVGGLAAFIPIQNILGIDEWVEWTPTPTTRVVTMPEGQFVYTSDDAELDHDIRPGMVESHILHRIVWHNVQYLPLNNILSAIGRINETGRYLDLNGKGSNSHGFSLQDEPDVLLFHNWDFTPWLDESGILRFDILYEFDELFTRFSDESTQASTAVTWNMMLRVKDGKNLWEEVKIKDSSPARKRYDTTDFSVLLTPDP